jgi:hypothetical protein
MKKDDELSDEEFQALLKAYNAERDAALLSRDPREVIKLLAKHTKHRLPSLEIAEITMHQSTTAVRSLPMALRAESKRWLLARGYHPYDDGDVPT